MSATEPNMGAQSTKGDEAIPPGAIEEVANPSTEPLDHLHGDALDAALMRRFTTAMETVTVGSEHWQLLKPANSDHLISEADYVEDERLPYWADLWPSSYVLSNVVAGLAGRNRRLLELGCGLGLCSTAAVHAGFDVTATDYYVDALHVARSNSARNTGREPVVRMVNWREWPDDLGTFDMIIAADVLYEEEYARLVADCLARSLTPDGMALIADPGRVALPVFHAHVPAVGLEIVSTTRVPYNKEGIKQEVQVMELRRRR